MKPKREMIVLLCLLGGIPLGSSEALACRNCGGGGYAPLPTTYVEVLPTTYVAPVSYFATSWVETAISSPACCDAPILAPTSLIYPTSYVYPTSYYLPTVYTLGTPVSVVDVGTVTTSYATVLNASTPVASPQFVETKAAPAPLPAPTSKTAPAGSAPSKSVPSTVESRPAPAAASQETGRKPQPEPERGEESATPAGGAPDSPVDSSVPSPPVAPVPEKEPATSGTGTPLSPAPSNEAPGPIPLPLPEPTNIPGEPKPPIAPGGAVLPPADSAAPPEPETSFRSTLKPVLTSMSTKPYRRTSEKGDLNVLEGKVIGIATGQPEPGVRVVISERGGRFKDQEMLTDDKGRYEARLPDGEWTVRVTTAHGRVYPVSELVVNQGQITDDQGRDIPSLTINR